MAWFFSRRTVRYTALTPGQISTGAGKRVVLFRDGAGWALFVVQQDRAVKRAVQVGQRNGLSAQILAGINEGERVVAHPDDRVRDGVRVALQ